MALMCIRLVIGAAKYEQLNGPSSERDFIMFGEKQD